MIEIIRKKVIEYDIKKCGMSVLRIAGIINDEQYNSLLNMPKRQSSIYITTTLRKEIMNKDGIDILSTIKKMRDEAVGKFIWCNSIKPADVIEVNFDAIWTTKYCSKLEINGLQFVAKRDAELLLKFDKMRIYYSIEDGVYDRGVQDGLLTPDVKSELINLCSGLLHKYEHKVFKSAHELFKKEFITKGERDTLLLSI